MIFSFVRSGAVSGTPDQADFAGTALCPKTNKRSHSPAFREALQKPIRSGKSRSWSMIRTRRAGEPVRRIAPPGKEHSLRTARYCAIPRRRMTMLRRLLFGAGMAYLFRRFSGGRRMSRRPVTRW